MSPILIYYHMDYSSLCLFVTVHSNSEKPGSWDSLGGPVVGTSPSNAGDAGLLPDWGARIPHASWPKTQNIKQKQYCNKFNKDFKKLSTSKKKLKKTQKPGSHHMSFI